MPENSFAAKKPGRIWTMDELRGVAVFCMIFYHGFYTVGFLFGDFWGKFFFHFFMPAEPFFAGLFMFISGIACNLSHSNLGRGLKLFALAMGVTLVTWLALPDDIITFGILHFLAVCMILAGLLKPAVDRYRFSWMPVMVCVFLYLLTVNIQFGFLGPGGPLAVRLPNALYATNWLAPLGFHNDTFESADYFPMLPWVFVYTAGIFVGKLAKAGKFPVCLYKSRVPFFSWMGRYALILYLVHQPIIYGVCLLIQHLAR